MKIAKFSAVLVAAAFATFVALANPTTAYAHDVLVDQTPADGEVFDDNPGEIQLTFNNSILDPGEGATVINVLDSNGSIVVEDIPNVIETRAIQALPEELPDGAYRMVWRVVSSDGHTITGTSVFAFGADAEEALASFPDLESGDGNSEGSSDPSSNSLPLWAIIGGSAAAVAVGVIVLFMFMRKTTPPQN